MFQSYPVEWAEYFSERNLYRIDLVFCHAIRNLLPFSWDDDDFRTTLTNSQKEILVRAKEYGIEYGYTIPIHRSYSAPVSCSVIPHSKRIHPAGRAAVHIMAGFMYEAVFRTLPNATIFAHINLRLSNRERQCLEFAAQGKSDWEIVAIVGIAERTVHAHIERAKRRLGVITRVQAIVQFLFECQFFFGDVIRYRRITNQSREYK